MRKELLKINGGIYYQKDFNMKVLYLIMIVFLLGCSKKIVHTNNVEMTNKLRINIILDDETNMELSIKNNSEKELQFSDSKCRQALKITPDINCVKNIIVLDAGKEEKFNYPYRLNELFQLESDTEYEILLSYKGGIMTSEGKVLEGDVSTRQKFAVQ